jgi:alpha-glucosidase
MKFSCQKTSDGLHLEIGRHEGSYPAWWKEIHAEVFGWAPKQSKVFMNEKEASVHIDRNPQSFGFVVADDGKGAQIEVK